MATRFLKWAVGYVAVLLLAVAQSASAQQAGSLNAYAPISTTGQFLETGPGVISYVGLTTGIMFFETDAGVMNSGNLSCTIAMDVETSSSDALASGQCRILGTQGKVLFGRYECTGSLGLGCDGSFSVTGGSDEFEGASGGGKFLMRTLIAENMSLPNQGIAGGTNGIAVWQDLEINLPTAQP